MEKNRRTDNGLENFKGDYTFQTKVFVNKARICGDEGTAYATT